MFKTWAPEDFNPTGTPVYGHGLCKCGCGEEVARYRYNVPEQNIRVGDLRGFKLGHNARRWPGVKVDDRGHATPCWIWQGGVFKKGYGSAYDGKTVLAHRWYYQRAFGEIEPGLQLDHLCEVKLCVNPAHLEAVTSAEHGRRHVERRRAARAEHPLVLAR